jgi:hypothetical protein
MLATLEAKIGKEHEVAAFLKSALPLVEAEPGTAAWFAVWISPTGFSTSSRMRLRETLISPARSRKPLWQGLWSYSRQNREA